VNRDIIEYLILIIVLSILLVVYFFYIKYDDKKRINYYKTVVLYESDWDKYSDMVRVQKRVIFRKKIQLIYYKVLVFFKGVIIWK